MPHITDAILVRKSRGMVLNVIPIIESTIMIAVQMLWHTCQEPRTLAAPEMLPLTPTILDSFFSLVDFMALPPSHPGFLCAQASCHPIHCRAQHLLNFFSDGLEFFVADLCHLHGWPYRRNRGLSAFCVHHHIAGKHHPKVLLSLERLMRHGRVARSQDHIVLPIYIEFFLECLLDIDFSEDAKAPHCKRILDFPHNDGMRNVNGLFVIVHRFTLFSYYSVIILLLFCYYSVFS